MSSKIEKYLVSRHGVSILLAKYQRAKLKGKILSWELIHTNDKLAISEKRRREIENSILTANQNPYIKVLEDEIRGKDAVISNLQAVLAKYVALGERVQNIDHDTD